MSGGYRTVPSPNFDERPFAPDMVVLHYTDMPDVEAAIAWLAAPESRVSAHYVITTAGEIVAMVDEAKRAWHAGVDRSCASSTTDGGPHRFRPRLWRRLRLQAQKVVPG